MLNFLGKRVAQLIPTLLGVALLTFLLLRAIPGDPTTMAGGETMSEEVRQALIVKWHLDRPLAVQFWYYLKGLPTLDLGISMKRNEPVAGILGEYFVRTLQLGLCAFVLSATVGISLGIVAALAKGTWLDRGLLALTLVGISTPVFVLGVLLIVAAAAVGFPFTNAGVMNVDDPTLTGLRGFAATRLGFDPPFIVLPALALGVRSIAYLARMTRSAVLEAGTADHLRTARAKGLSPAAVALKHQLKNAMIPITTVVGLNFADFLTGAIIVETVFGWPGLGLLVKNSIANRDLPVIMGAVLFITTLFVAINFLVDVAYALFDPRIRVG